MYVKTTAYGLSRSATDIDGHRAFLEPAYRLGRPLKKFGFSPKPTHKVTHFHMLDYEK